MKWRAFVIQDEKDVFSEKEYASGPELEWFGIFTRLLI